jgi:hypothetical protein
VFARGASAQPAPHDAVAQPEVAQPSVVAQPVVAQPVVAQPVVAQPVGVQPVGVQPVGVQPVVVQPAEQAASAQPPAPALPPGTPASAAPLLVPAPPAPTSPMPPRSAGGAMSKSANVVDDDTLHVPIPSVLGVNIALTGYFWADTGYMSRTNAQPGQYDQSVNYLQGRFVLGAGFSRALGEYYAAARVEFLGLVNEYARSQYEPHTLDAFVQVGHRRWFDVQVGRFLAWEVFHRGQGIEFWTAEEAGALGGPALYWLDFARGYRNESGQAAVHFYPFSFLKFEVAGVYGQENNQNNLGVRPALHLTLGPVQFLAGYELLKQAPQTEADKVELTSQGYAARLQYTLKNTVTFGADFAQAFVASTDIQGLVDTGRSLKKYTVGGFVDIDFWRNSIGLGYFRTEQQNQRGEHNTQDQAFLSYLFRFPIPGLSAKAVYGFARAHVEDIDTGTAWDNFVQSFRVRVSYEFN